MPRYHMHASWPTGSELRTASNEDPKRLAEQADDLRELGYRVWTYEELSPGLLRSWSPGVVP